MLDLRELGDSSSILQSNAPERGDDKSKGPRGMSQVREGAKKQNEEREW